jgi:uncharacterized protein (DUF1697 family)
VTTFIALLRAVNVGGTGKLPMTDLKRMCLEIGFENVETYIASGNVVFDSAFTEPEVRTALAKALAHYAGKPVGVLIRTRAEMRVVLESNPFPNEPGNRTLAIFLESKPDANALAKISGQTIEQIVLGTREIYVAYGENMGRSKLKIPTAATGTARNMNTVTKLVAMASKK